MKCDNCEKEITRSSTGFMEQELIRHMWRRLTGLPYDGRLGNYFVCNELRCKEKQKVIT